MEQGTSEIYILDHVTLALEDEKTQLEEKLETDIETSERQRIEECIAEIWSDLEIYKIGLEEPSAQAGQKVRRSEREKHPTEKMLEFRRQQIGRKERKFVYICKLQGRGSVGQIQT